MTDQVQFIVGTEKRLAEIICADDVMPLLEWGVKAGAGHAALLDSDGETIWEARGGNFNGGEVSCPVMIEGEQAGTLLVRGRGVDGVDPADIAALLGCSLQSLVKASLKRILTTEIHTTVVNQSYEELLETNRQLSISEGKLRELTKNLEQQVAERTAKLERALTRLLQQEKMASVGQLAAGIAHEINNPMGFITSNLNTLKRYAGRMVTMLDYYGSLLASDPAHASLLQRSFRKWQELRLDSICADLDSLIGQSLEGAERVKKIVADLKGFSHIDDSAMAIVDLNAEIDRTLGVLEHRFSVDTDVVKNYSELPGFSCNPAQICQLFLHIIENSLEARPKGLRLIVSTQNENGTLTISFADNGPGIPEQIRNRIFDPFFTTKEVGAGTGMGLSVAYDIVTGYGGSIYVASPPSGGTIITIKLPGQRNRDVTLR